MDKSVFAAVKIKILPTTHSDILSDIKCFCFALEIEDFVDNVQA
jgi:hypothetical protein